MMGFDSEALGPSGWFFLLFHAAYLPWRAWRSRARLLGADRPSRAALYLNTIVLLALLLPLSLVVALTHHVELYPRAWRERYGV